MCQSTMASTTLQIVHPLEPADRRLMKPILRDIPEFFETERLIVRCPRPGDGQLVHEAVVETLRDLRAWPASLPWAM